MQGSLVRHSGNNANEDTGHLRVNLRVKSFSRLPYLRFGTGHIYNSFFTNIPTSRMGAHVLVESNIFSNITLAIVTDLDSDDDVEQNNVFMDSYTRIRTATS
ncbi:hypothetical protein BDZ89DRAFT_1076545 [Hymenopellis radicata]|nr:hypothetical protein BDZ89DRAFT_1076545 [Hymenopellis radicata]